jgi:uncharacterized protein (UPF0333 family)
MNKVRTKSRFKLSEKGQVLIEYILLMVIVISCASILMRALVSRQSGRQGMVIRVWDDIIRTLGNDMPDCRQTNFNTPNCPP